MNVAGGVVGSRLNESVECGDYKWLGEKCMVFSVKI